MNWRDDFRIWPLPTVRTASEIVRRRGEIGRRPRTRKLTFHDPKATSGRKRDKQVELWGYLPQKMRHRRDFMNNQPTTVQASICAAWIDLLRANRGAKGHPDQYYALSVENIRGQGEEFELHLTFRAGRTYCCCEELCHTGVFTEQRWRKVRSALAARGVEPQEPLVVRICTRLEAGARLHYGKSGEPEPEMYDQGPWTLTVRERSPVAPNHHE